MLTFSLELLLWLHLLIKSCYQIKYCKWIAGLINNICYKCGEYRLIKCIVHRFTFASVVCLMGGTVLLRLLGDVVQELGSSYCNILLSESFRILSPNPLNSAGHLRNTSCLCGHIYCTCLFVFSVCNKSSYLVMHLI